EPRAPPGGNDPRLSLATGLRAACRPRQIGPTARADTLIAARSPRHMRRLPSVTLSSLAILVAAAGCEPASQTAPGSDAEAGASGEASTGDGSGKSSHVEGGLRPDARQSNDAKMSTSSDSGKG